MLFMKMHYDWEKGGNMFGILVESGPDFLMILEGSLAISRNMGLSNLLLTNS